LIDEIEHLLKMSSCPQNDLQERVISNFISGIVHDLGYSDGEDKALLCQSILSSMTNRSLLGVESHLIFWDTRSNELNRVKYNLAIFFEYLSIIHFERGNIFML
jgi:hypothetical protein